MILRLYVKLTRPEREKVFGNSPILIGFSLFMITKRLFTP